MIWKLIAKLLSRPAIVDWLIARGAKTPYTDIYNGKVLYMRRFWLFNPYQSHKPTRWASLMHYLPSIRLHHIVKPDDARDKHDHPWDARTIILRNGYVEERLEQPFSAYAPVTWTYLRLPGDTATVKFNEFHSITDVFGDGAWTMFITWKYQGTWGFMVDGAKIHWKTYRGNEK